MEKTGIIVADGARARFITYEPTRDVDLDGKPRCIEQADLVNPEGRAAPREQFSDRPGRLHSSRGGPAHLADDHRQRHQEEVDRRFARRILEATQPFAETHQLGRLILIAAPRLLGCLRAQLDGRRLADLDIVELNEDHTQRPLLQIAALLIQRELLRGPAPTLA